MGTFSNYLCELLGYVKFLPSSTGVEACESACKRARRWGYVVKGVEHDKASIVMANGCFWGRSITASGGCDDPQRYNNFGPFTPGFPLVPYDDVDAIETYFKSDPNCVGIMLEPIQGEGGVIIPQEGYLKKVKALCEKYNVLLAMRYKLDSEEPVSSWDICGILKKINQISSLLAKLSQEVSPQYQAYWLVMKL